MGSATKFDRDSGYVAVKIAPEWPQGMAHLAPQIEISPSVASGRRSTTTPTVFHASFSVPPISISAFCDAQKDLEATYEVHYAAPLKNSYQNAVMMVPSMMTVATLIAWDFQVRVTWVPLGM